MKGIRRLMGLFCEHCPFCRYARAHPESLLAWTYKWHAPHCPAWKAQMALAAEQQAAECQPDPLPR